MTNQHQYDLLSLVKEAYKTDTWVQTTLQTIANKQTTAFVLNEQGVILKDNRICIPNDISIKTLLLQEAHDNIVSGGHSGINKTKEKLARHYWWNNMQQDVEDYINSCIACQSNKSRNSKPYGLMKSITAAPTRWHTISMDFIGPLKRSRSGFDAILVVVDTLSKYAHFIPTHSTATAPQTAELIFHQVVKHHGLPQQIISDRDTKFTSSFWRALWSLCGTKLRMSTSGHPETDGQTERTNRTLEEYIRSYVDNNMDDWDKLLTYAQIAYNNHRSSSTGYTPYFLNHGDEINLPVVQIANTLKHSQEHDELCKNETALQRVQALQQHIATAHQHLLRAQDRQKQYADTRRTHMEFEVGQQVMLSAKDINMNFYHRDMSNKLRSKYIGPLTIVKKISALNYELELPTPLKRIHPVFHISKLKKYQGEQGKRFTEATIARQQNSRPISVEQNAQGEELFEVEQVLDKRTRTVRGKRIIEYLIKWKDYPEWENIWEPASSLQAARHSIALYEQCRKGEREQQQQRVSRSTRQQVRPIMHMHARECRYSAAITPTVCSGMVAGMQQCSHADGSRIQQSSSTQEVKGDVYRKR